MAAKDENIFKYDRRKAKKVRPLATILIEHLTEESNGHITAAAIKIKLRRILNLNVHDPTQNFYSKFSGQNLAKKTIRVTIRDQK